MLEIYITSNRDLTTVSVGHRRDDAKVEQHDPGSICQIKILIDPMLEQESPTAKQGDKRKSSPRKRTKEVGMTKTCTACHRELAIEEFYTYPQTRTDGGLSRYHRALCKKCWNRDRVERRRRTGS